MALRSAAGARLLQRILLFGYAAQCLGYGRLGNPIRFFDKPA